MVVWLILFMKAKEGKIGKSLCEEDRLDTALDILRKADEKGVCIHLPSDSVIADNFAADANTSTAPSNNFLMVGGFGYRHQCL